jgi:hypothetical protein
MFSGYAILVDKRLRLKVYSLEHFWLLCPYTVKELNTNRNTEKIAYSTLGLAWMYMAGYTSEQCAKHFNKKSHGITLDALRKVLSCLENPLSQSTELNVLLQKLVNIAKEKPYHTGDVYETHLMCMVYLENQLKL